MINYYRILGLKDFASLEEIKTAYRKLSKKLHPDVNDGDKFFEERFVEIQQAYDVLSDRNKKIRYDNDLKKAAGNIPVFEPHNFQKYPANSSNFSNLNYKKPKATVLKPNLSKQMNFVVVIILLLFSLFVYLLFRDEQILLNAQNRQYRKDSFSIGSTKADVCEAQGNPTRKYEYDTSEVWYYKGGAVIFNNDKVSEILNEDGTLKVIQKKSGN